MAPPRLGLADRTVFFRGIAAGMVGKRKGVSKVQRSCKKVKEEGPPAAAAASSSSPGLKTCEQRDGKDSQISSRSRISSGGGWGVGDSLEKLTSEL